MAMMGVLVSSSRVRRMNDGGSAVWKRLPILLVADDERDVRLTGNGLRHHEIPLKKSPWPQEGHHGVVDLCKWNGLEVRHVHIRVPSPDGIRWKWDFFSGIFKSVE